jgi:hypothetical protein
VSHANLRDISALKCFGSGFKRFDAEARASLKNTKLEAERQILVLEQQKRECEERTVRAAQAVRLAANALANCQASGEYDKDGNYHAPNCSAQVAMLQKTKRMLEEAKMQLEAAQKRLKQLQDQTALFLRALQRFFTYCDTSLPKAVNTLNRLSGIAEDYVALSAPNSVPSSEGFEKIVDAAIGAPLGLLEALGGILSTSSPRSARLEPDHPTLPSTLPRPPHGGHWGFVDITDLDLVHNHVHSPADFKKESLEEMQRGWRVFWQEIYPALHQGADADHFYNADQEMGVSHQYGTKKVFDAFLGLEPIRLEPKNGRWDVMNGFHRIYAAKTLGLTKILANLQGEL